MSETYPYYLLWSGRAALGDTPGVFDDAAYSGLLLQIPFTIDYIDPEQSVVNLVLITTDVEVYNDPATGTPLSHPVYIDWEPGTSFPVPIGALGDDPVLDGRREFHLFAIPADTLRASGKKQHTLALQVNPCVAAGFRDDFVLKRIEIDNRVGAKIGW
jgi:hypothetical protein